MNYHQFLEQKRIIVEPSGFEPGEINPMLFDFQRDVVRWALRRGKAALFLDTGLGKTFCQVEWAKHVATHTNGNVLIFAPLAVAQQTKDEALKLGVDITVCRGQDDVRPGINIANYDILHKFDPGQFAGLVLDESSILKAYGGKTRKALQTFAIGIPYRLACTATPAPNDLLELINHAEFLGIMTGKEIIALYFTQDGNSTQKWRLKGHSRDDFWKWMAEWSIAMRKPSDLGYSDDRFILPPLNIHQVTVKNGQPMNGYLVPVEARTMTERRAARRSSLPQRVQKCAEIINGGTDAWIVWCDLNGESGALAKAIPDAVEIRGSNKPQDKEQRMIDFARGNIRVLVTKPTVAGFGMNWQHCHNVAFVGLSDSFEQQYQAIRRCWRFGQRHPVDVHMITSELEGAVVENVRRKEKQAAQIFDAVVKHMAVNSTIKQAVRNEIVYRPSQPMRLPQWIEV